MEDRTVSDTDVTTTLSELNESMFFVTSAKTGERVEDAFVHLAEKLERGM
jgi:hypothetical protein